MFVPRLAIKAGGQAEGGGVAPAGPVTAVPHQVNAIEFDDVWVKQPFGFPWLATALPRDLS